MAVDNTTSQMYDLFDILINTGVDLENMQSQINTITDLKVAGAVDLSTQYYNLALTIAPAFYTNTKFESVDVLNKIQSHINAEVYLRTLPEYQAVIDAIAKLANISEDYTNIPPFLENPIVQSMYPELYNAWGA